MGNPHPGNCHPRQERGPDHPIQKRDTLLPLPVMASDHLPRTVHATDYDPMIVLCGSHRRWPHCFPEVHSDLHRDVGGLVLLSVLLPWRGSVAEK